MILGDQITDCERVNWHQRGLYGQAKNCWPRETGRLGSRSLSACDLGQVSSAFWAWFFSSVTGVSALFTALFLSGVLADRAISMHILPPQSWTTLCKAHWPCPLPAFFKICPSHSQYMKSDFPLKAPLPFSRVMGSVDALPMISLAYIN